MMYIRKYQPADVLDIQRIYQVCFSGPPWNQEVTAEEAELRWQEHSSKEGFTCFVAVHDHQIVGAAWFNVISRNELTKERGHALANFATSINLTPKFIWIRETIVDPAFQGQGIASRLKEKVVQEVKEHFVPPIMLLTRMRDDNTNIVHINEKLGFKRTGIKVKSKATPDLLHEYWHLVLNKC
ncbi:hypothetical protein COU01_00370 [Candidatus Falkowbacteria bacterium CG10_big_fil_rev_8_21_14_0_10_44_15]|uniref:N-acetyltransferase domain-containing protein n=1 Tax=Candidatus Falkowbacteria bacterium CG10_big_fil_rev_8_21_14_0_10_44_15 TaxID=1974569 RepID=A0A2H0V0V3_9BACT|nr:MAG: hypothetical protein COU01_00370 [Candidatus Falkowbacteria bacterium CG10_big_fil_rev_8_21_14_0_10_44_15]